MISKMSAATAAAVALGILAVGPAFSQSAEEFYKNKQLRLVVGTPTGGDYDQGARTLARYFTKHMPSGTTIIVQNMPGASTIVSANYLYSVAPKDGTVFGSFSRNVPVQAVLGSENLKADPRQFGWIGGSSLPTLVCVISGKAQVKTFSDALTKEVIVGGTGPGTSPSIAPTILSQVLGAKFRVVEGYGSTTNVLLAVERGEVEGLCNSFSSYRTTHAELIRSGRIKVLVHTSEEKFADTPNVPSVFDFAKNDEQRQLLRFAFASSEFGRPYVAPPNIPADRLALLRKAFADTLADPELIQEAQKQGMDMSYRAPAGLEKLLAQFYASPPELVKQAQELMPSLN